MSAVVVAWTPDEYGAAALSAGVAEARAHAYSVVVVNGTRGDALVDPRYASDASLSSLRSSLTDSGLPFEVHQTAGSDVAEQVLSVAASSSASLIVLGLRRRTPVGKLLMGSVAQRVLLSASCPVLCVHP